MPGQPLSQGLATQSCSLSKRQGPLYSLDKQEFLLLSDKMVLGWVTPHDVVKRATFPIDHSCHLGGVEKVFKSFPYE